MSTMAVTSGGIRSTLNPNAPLFIPAAFRQVEDFSPEWYELVKTSTWFREHWFHKNEGLETFDDDADEDDILNMLPESFDLGINDEFSNFEGFHEDYLYSPSPKEETKAGLNMNVDTLLKNLSLRSPKGYGVRNLTNAAEFRGKPIPAISPKPSPRRIIQQPR